eukprot:jgi/Botrbrau1/4625/Bobra.60_2s0108.1
MRMKTLTDPTVFYLLPTMFIRLLKYSQSEVLFSQHIEDKLAVSGKCQANSSTRIFSPWASVDTFSGCYVASLSHISYFSFGCQFSFWEVINTSCINSEALPYALSPHFDISS